MVEEKIKVEESKKFEKFKKSFYFWSGLVSVLFLLFGVPLVITESSKQGEWWKLVTIILWIAIVLYAFTFVSDRASDKRRKWLKKN